jgi:hypothetical protein
VTELVFGERTEVVGERAFYECRQLRLVRFGPALKVIAAGAFTKCEALTQIVGFVSLKTIGNEAFAFSGLARLELPAEMIEIGLSAFSDCPLVEVILPKKLGKLCDCAFRRTKVSEVDCGTQIIEVGKEVFYDCRFLKKIVVGDIGRWNEDFLAGVGRVEEFVFRGGDINIVPGKIWRDCFSWNGGHGVIKSRKFAGSRVGGIKVVSE